MARPALPTGCRSTRLKARPKSLLDVPPAAPLVPKTVDAFAPASSGDAVGPLKFTLTPHSNLLYHAPSALPVSYVNSLGGNCAAAARVTASPSNRTPYPRSSAGMLGTSRPKLRPCFPVEMRALPGALSSRELEIYNLSDSEDERVELAKVQGGGTYGLGVVPAVSDNQQTKFKFIVKV